MRTKKKTVEQKKNRNSQKSVKSVQLMGVGVYVGKDFWKRYVFSLEWKSEGVMDDHSGDSEEDEGEEDWFRQGWCSETYWYESVKPLQYQCSCLPASIMLPMRKLLFWKKMLCSENVVLCLLAKSCKDSIIALADKFHIRSDDVLNASVFTIRDWFWFYFSNLIA